MSLSKRIFILLARAVTLDGVDITLGVTLCVVGKRVSSWFVQSLVPCWTTDSCVCCASSKGKRFIVDRRHVSRIVLAMVGESFSGDTEKSRG